MNKAELIKSVARKTGLTGKQASAAVDAVLETIRESVAGGEKVYLTGFGTFEKRARSARTGRNPQTKEAIHLPARSVPTFRPGKKFRDNVKL